MEKKTALILGGAAAAGLGLYFWQKSKASASAAANAAAQETATPAPVLPSEKPKIAAPPAPPAPKTQAPVPSAAPPAAPPAAAPSAGVVPAPAGVSFNEMPSANKQKLWDAVTKGTLKADDSNPNFYSYDASLAKTLDESGSMILMQRNDAQGGDALYILAGVSGTDASGNDVPVFWAATESDAVAMASGPNAAWTLFLRPNEWRTMAENAWAAGQANSAPSAPSVPSTGNPTLDQFGQSLQGQLSQAAAQVSQGGLPAGGFDLGSFKL